jgi:osmoprotectant transport system permease protein
MREERAAELGISRISDLVKHPQLVLGFSNEFMERGDGWPSLRDAYRLPQKDVQGLDHDLAYRGIAAGSLDVIDLYATDAEIDYYGLRTLEDDLRHFPEYRAVFLFRLDRARQLPRMRDALQRLAGEIPPSEMIAMNQRAKLERVPAARVAAEWLRAEFEFVDRSVTESRWQLLWRRTLEHLWMVCIALAAAIVISVPIGVLAYRKPGLGTTAARGGGDRADDPGAGAAGAADQAVRADGDHGGRLRCSSTACCRSCGTRTRGSPGWGAT